jgi:rubrerythrin
VDGARDWLLERTKRPALRLLHRTRDGEALLVRLYLEAERHAEQAAPWEPMLASAPRWLAAWLDQHRADERRHAALFATRLAELTGARDDARGDERDKKAGFDAVSRRKLAALHRLVVAFAPEFSAGAVVPAIAVAWRMEEMGVRVFARHVEVLAGARPEAPLLPVLCAVLADERRHARACRRSLERLVPDRERPLLALLVKWIDRIERRFGVLGALLLWTTGGLLWMRAKLASSISR